MIRVGSTQVDAKQFGLNGTGTADDAGPFMAMLDRVPDGADVHFEGSPTFLLLGGIKPTKRRGVTLTTDRNPFPDGVNVPTIQYDGPPNGTVLDFDRCIACTVKGFAIEANDRDGKRAPAGTLINFDGDEDTSGEPQTYGRDCLVEDVKITTYGPVAGLTAIAISRKATKLQDRHRIRNVHANLNGAGTFLHQGPSYNAKGTIVEYSSATACEKGVEMENGSIHLTAFWANFCEWNLFLRGASGVCTEQLSYSEGSKHHAFYNVPIDVRAGSLAAAYAVKGGAGEGYVHFGAGAQAIDFRRHTFGNLPKTSPLYTFENDSSHRVVVLTRNLYPWTDPTGTTLAQLGLDLTTFRTLKDAGIVRLEDERGIADLPSGCLEWPTLPLGVSESPDTNPNFLPQTALRLSRGEMSRPYLDTATRLVHGKILVRLSDGSLGAFDLGPVTKIKPSWPDKIWPDK